MDKNNIHLGFSLFELMVVTSLFMIITVIGTQIVVNSLRGSQKSESQSNVREDVVYAIEIMERKLRSASDIDCSLSNTTRINYTDNEGVAGVISCSSGRLFYNSVPLTGDNVVVTCTNVFTCSNDPNTVTIDIRATSAGISGILGSTITLSSQVVRRSSN